MDNIKLKVKLSAYTKGILPKNLISDVPETPKDHLYVRKYGEWIDLENTQLGQIIKLPVNSGLTLTPTEDKNVYELTLNQEILKELPLELLDDTTYYIINTEPELFINGGTAYSDGTDPDITNNEYGQIIKGGSNYTLELLPINAKGVNNGN